MGPADEIPDISSGIPLNPEEKNYKLTYWHQEAWQKIKNRTGHADLSENEDPASSILTLFFESASGQPVSLEVKKEVQTDLSGYWLDMLRSGERPTNYYGLGLIRREHYRDTMENKYPWLRLCDGHWKVRMIWINYFKQDRIAALITKYKIPGMYVGGDTPESPIVIESSEAGTPPKRTKIKAPSLPIIISDLEGSSPTPVSSDTDDSSPTPGMHVSSGTKRQHEGGNDPGLGPSKRSKGKEKVAAGPDFHPMRPVPRKKPQARVGTVSKHDPLPAKYFLNTTRSTYCTHPHLFFRIENTDSDTSQVQNAM